VTIYVEGGGDEASLKTQCRRAFNRLLKRAGFENRMPTVKALGGRESAFDAFRTAHEQKSDGEFIFLLVDSETIPVTSDPWAHLKTQANWEKPDGATDDQAQLMVVCMETWLLADPEAFAAYFGKDFKKAKLPTSQLEKRPKADLYEAIKGATVNAKPKGKYGKTRDSFKLLSEIDPVKLRKCCSWADRFFDSLNKYC
jgi:hypothetical protein